MRRAPSFDQGVYHTTLPKVLRTLNRIVVKRGDHGVHAIPVERHLADVYAVNAEF
jgi:hypothetical protein